MVKYDKLIPQNVAILGARRICVTNPAGYRIGQIPLGNLTPPNPAHKLYSFGALSDVHIGDDTAGNDAENDFARALEYLSQHTDFICISGDLVHYDGEWLRIAYKDIINTYAKVPVYACGGNHDAGAANIEEIIESYTGHPLYYSIEYGDDVFVLVGNSGNQAGTLFTDAELDWLENTLNAYKHKRVFLFQHVRPDDACGNALGIYKFDIWDGKDKTRFEALLRGNPNVIFFHGHSHLKFDLQERVSGANIDKLFGCWSVHVPSITVPRGPTSAVDTTRVDLYAESEGYIVDVYPNGIHLRGRDFVKGEFLPIASYWLDTTLQIVEAGTYSDPTGTIE